MMIQKQTIRLYGLLSMALLTTLSSFTATQNSDEKKSLNIVFIGDSITESNGTDAPSVHTAEFLLDHQEKIERLDFSNQGHSGYTTLNFLPAQENTFREVEKAADSLQKLNEATLIFSLMLGTNDSAIDGPLGAPVSPENYRKNLMIIIDRLLKDFPHCKVIVHHPTWYSPNTYNGSRYLAAGLNRLQSYFKEISLLAKSYKSTHPARVFVGDQQAFGYFRKNYLRYLTPENGNAGTFYLHPNKEGAKVLGKFWGESILKILDQF